jgi:hypothetical protein
VWVQIHRVEKTHAPWSGHLHSDALYPWNTEIRELYLKIEHSPYALPEMRNTDGDSLEMRPTDIPGVFGR